MSKKKLLININRNPPATMTSEAVIYGDNKRIIIPNVYKSSFVKDLGYGEEVWEVKYDASNIEGKKITMLACREFTDYSESLQFVLGYIHKLEPIILCPFKVTSRKHWKFHTNHEFLSHSFLITYEITDNKEMNVYTKRYFLDKISSSIINLVSQDDRKLKYSSGVITFYVNGYKVNAHIQEGLYMEVLIAVIEKILKSLNLGEVNKSVKQILFKKLPEFNDKLFLKRWYVNYNETIEVYNRKKSFKLSLNPLKINNIDIHEKYKEYLLSELEEEL